MKDNTHSPTDSIEKKQYKKSYLMRIIEERQAFQEIEHCIFYEQEYLIEDTSPPRKPD